MEPNKNPRETPVAPVVTLRPLERSDLHFVHVLNNNRSVMGYWFEEPYESFVELEELYRKHIHDQSERRFIAEHQFTTGHDSSGQAIEAPAHERVGLVELVEIDHLHRRAEFLIMITPEHQGRGFAKAATRSAINYAFRVLNLYKLYLLVDVDNAAAIRVYEGAGFKREGVLVDEFFSDGRYRSVIRMCMFQHEVLGSEVTRRDG
ncbi:spermidine N1-acetyltransferase [Lysobacter sp. A289]